MPPSQKSRSVLDRKMVFVVELMHSYWGFFFGDVWGSPSIYPSSQHPAPGTQLLNYYIREWNLHKPSGKK